VPSAAWHWGSTRQHQATPRCIYAFHPYGALWVVTFQIPNTRGTINENQQEETSSIKLRKKKWTLLQGDRYKKWPGARTHHQEALMQPANLLFRFQPKAGMKL
jgi:hypothetical protein